MILIALLSLSFQLYGSDYQIEFLVDAPHLDYSSSTSLFKSLTKRRHGDVGHAWVRLVDFKRRKFVEVGHSGERGIFEPKYAEGVLQYHAQGDPNPVRYLHAVLTDGYCEGGSGGHTPSYAARCAISEGNYQELRAFLSPSNYDYCSYSFTEHQCCHLVSRVAHLIGIDLDVEVTVPVDSNLLMCGRTVQLYTDPRYKLLTFASPDVLEAALRKKVAEGVLEKIPRRDKISKSKNLLRK